ncbi:ABC transporter ATP-binding protein [Halosimplex pelagicum]|uniref:ABC transporter ATP-binding protein n=1 Tax=Halosimplex pelagicum TaxID=869886 RepID=A0A7D5TBZ4_9EURY|nr:ABC transporter ATP-binding protein [Halosimplex pelagicum]QLH81735.1 ABC transporter ATP-binding protein [Halosimplex pelagicum]
MSDGAGPSEDAAATAEDGPTEAPPSPSDGATASGTDSERRGGSVHIESLSKVYDPDGEHVVAVDDVTLNIDAGEFITVLGPSGCGKSTLMNCIAGFIEPTGGNIYADGEVVNGPGADRGLVFQDNRLLPWKTIEENVELGPKMRGAVTDGRARRLLEEMGLDGFEDAYPAELSGGMQQRAEIARLLANDPEIMLMDEPFSALDALTKEILQEMLLEVWDEDNRTVVFITHDVEEAIFLADRILVMTAAPGRVKELIDVDLDRPRDRSVTTTDRFTELKEHVLELIHEEAKEAME